MMIEETQAVKRNQMMHQTLLMRCLELIIINKRDCDENPLGNYPNDNISPLLSTFNWSDNKDRQNSTRKRTKNFIVTFNTKGITKYSFEEEQQHGCKSFMIIFNRNKSLSLRLKKLLSISRKDKQYQYVFSRALKYHHASNIHIIIRKCARCNIFMSTTKGAIIVGGNKDSGKMHQ